MFGFDMINVKEPFAGYINHIEEKNMIINCIATGDYRSLSKFIGDYFSFEEIEEMEQELFNTYGIKTDLSFLCSG